MNTDQPSKHLKPPAGYRGIPRSVWMLGLVSMCMDISSELVHSLLPVFMATVLGASMVTIGFIEGIAEATAAVTKVFSGALSDYLRRRKLLAVLGYGLAAITKPIFPLAQTIGWVFMARFIDRVGKGIRGAPRDALVADITPPELRGAAYGLRQALDSSGAFIGPALAIVLLAVFVNDIRMVLWVAVIPAFIAVVVLVVGVHEPERKQTGHNKGGVSFSSAGRLPLNYWLVVTLGALFTLSRFSEAFLVLRAQDLGLALAFIPGVLIVMNIVYALTAYPAGAAADRLSTRTLLIAGLAVLIVADLLLASANSPLLAMIGTGFWGLHMGLTQGLFAKLVADHAPLDLRGTAFGIFNLISGAAMLLASIIAGLLWSLLGAPSTFLAGATFAFLAIIGLSVYRPGGVSA